MSREHAESPDADVFDLLSDGTRLAIVRELQRAAEFGEPALRFSELARRTNAGDTGRFNYHLTRLREGLIEKRPEGYRLTPTGAEIAETLVEAGPGT